jgi:ATP-binding cassette subfamily G (WHITE) protein 2 (PDR)
MFLLTVQFLLFTSTFSTMIIAAIDDAETAGNIGNLLFSLVLIFCGVLATPSQFPHFWIFLYRLSPFTYFVDALLSVGVANTQVVCAANEYLRFDAPAGQTCRDYMSTYISQAGGYLLDPNAMGQCQFCAVKDTNVFLAQVSSSYSHRWRYVCSYIP